MRARSTVVITAAAIVLAAWPARADEVPPPPTDCPDGTTGDGNHCGQVCLPAACESDSDCRQGTCQSRDLCLEDVRCGRYTGGYPTTLVTGVCGGGAPCSTGTCRQQRVCVRGAPAPSVAPPPSGPQAPSDPQAPSGPQAPSSSTTTPTPPRPEGAGTQGSSGSGCRLVPASAGDAAPTWAFAAALVGALIARFRKRA